MKLGFLCKNSKICQHMAYSNTNANALRALALKNDNTISKRNLAFATLKSSASKNCKGKYCKFFCNTATMQF